ncbi:hypothetical protein M422DRAFT_275697 [Sphaerobolus stellatus SS14]|uniref:Uncharacterized protein n=1 Tax=Sphaerobolus stellatus (strain SS14) TaxID=990650 RepID=A0A0C9TP42_SPHS4|nr:hypothetical protein M422DRAFT_275697 [Sphaerobolus stellatus SS14]
MDIFKNRAEPTASPAYPRFGLRHRRGRLPSASPPNKATNNTLGSPCHMPPPMTPSPKQPHIIGGLPRIAFASPSLSPLSTWHKSPATSLEQRQSRFSQRPPTPLQLEKKIKYPPMLDLRKVLKRKSSITAVSSCTAKKRKETLKSIPSPRSSPSPEIPDETTKVAIEKPKITEIPSASTSKNPSRPPRPLTDPEDITIFDPPIAVKQLSPKSTETERQRRALAKKKQLAIRAKLLSALPPDKISSSFKEKMDEREQQLSMKRAKATSNVITKRANTYVPTGNPSAYNVIVPDSDGSLEEEEGHTTVVVEDMALGTSKRPELLDREFAEENGVKPGRRIAVATLA